jgi:hypothetical protein
MAYEAMFATDTNNNNIYDSSETINTHNKA